MIISGYVYAASFERKQINSIESAYKLKEIVNKFIRYTIPYIGIYLAEAVGYLVVKRKADILEMVKVLLGGGVWARQLLLSYNASIHVYISDYLFYYP